MRYLILATLLLAGPAAAQTPVRATPPDGFKFMTQAEIDALVSKPDPGRIYGATFANDHETYFVEFVKRLDHGNPPEQHPHWIDQITILAGEGVLTYGGTLANAETAASGEVRGGTLNGASTKKLGPGDFVLIPAGLPHKFDAAPGKTLTYVVYKARQ